MVAAEVSGQSFVTARAVLIETDDLDAAAVSLVFVDEEGLLNPSARSAGGFRLYSVGDLERLLVIRRMKPLGFSIDEMRELLAVIHDLAASELSPDRQST